MNNKMIKYLVLMILDIYIWKEIFNLINYLLYLNSFNIFELSYLSTYYNFYKSILKTLISSSY